MTGHTINYMAVPFQFVGVIEGVATTSDMSDRGYLLSLLDSNRVSVLALPLYSYIRGLYR